MGMAVGLAAGEGSLEYVFSWGTAMPTTMSDHSEAAPQAALVGVVMGSRSDWDTMQHAVAKLEALGVPHEVRVVSAHRTPDVLFEYAATAQTRGLRAIIAGAGGAAHLPGMLAAKTAVPVLGVPVQSKALNGMDSLLSIVQMPAGIPVATFAIGNAGAANAGLFAAAMLAHEFPAIAAALEVFRAKQTQDVVEHDDPRSEVGRSEVGRA
jgi:5-(carboxyamino)imidazole ribonucleotide mutase